MKTMLLSLLAAFTLTGTVALAQGPSDGEVERLLVGKWRTADSASRGEVVYQPNGRFSSLFDKGPYQINVTGEWMVRDGVLVHHVLDWSPKELPWPNYVTPIHFPRWLSDPVRFRDRDTMTIGGAPYRRAF